MHSTSKVFDFFDSHDRFSIYVDLYWSMVIVGLSLVTNYHIINFNIV